MFRTVVYILAGLAGVSYVLPKILSLLADRILRYIHPDDGAQEAHRNEHS